VVLDVGTRKAIDMMALKAALEANPDITQKGLARLFYCGTTTPLVYLGPSPQQLNPRRIDASCNTYLRNQGFRLVRLWECDLYAEPERCKAFLHQKMKNGN